MRIRILTDFVGIYGDDVFVEVRYRQLMSEQAGGVELKISLGNRPGDK